MSCCDTSDQDPSTQKSTDPHGVDEDSGAGEQTVSPRPREPSEKVLDSQHRLIGPEVESFRAQGTFEFEGVPLTQPLLKKKEYFATWEGGNVVTTPITIMKWKIKCGAPSFPSAAEAAKKCPTVDEMAMNQLTAPPVPTDVQSTWMGHASFLMQCNGINILTDPVWSSRASPVQFSGPKRYVKPPIRLEDLPCPVHVVTISHNHYDHLDTDTVRKLRDLFDPIWVVPFGMKRDWFRDEFKGEKKKASLDKVYELEWWESLRLDVPLRTAFRDPCDKNKGEEEQQSRQEGNAHSTTHRELHITAVPVQHWSMRNPLLDRNKQLWCGFVYEVPLPMPLVSDIVEDKLGPDREPVPLEAIEIGDVTAHGKAEEGRDEEEEKKGQGVKTPSSPSPNSRQSQRKRVVRVCRMFHSGDTGYCPIFKHIGAVFGHFDLALLPIGAYEPRYVMAIQHVDPAEAVQIHLDLNRPTLSLGMHWGTWILTDEPIDEPPKLLAECMAKEHLSPSEFVALKHGETVTVPIGLN